MGDVCRAVSGPGSVDLRLSGRQHLGSRVYNAAHTYLAPVLLGALGGGIGAPICVRIALIWCAHIGFDRVLGFGLKYASGFGDTHLGQARGPKKPF